MSEFKSIANIEQNFTPLFKLPQDLINLFKTLDISTGKVDLTLRGDGIQAKLIPEMLYFIAKKEQSLTTNTTTKGAKAKKYFIWGFEEPENSYEYKNAQLLANRFKEVFSKTAQIFLTTHSFNFISTEGTNISTYRVWKDDSIDSSKITFIKRNSQGILKLNTSAYANEGDKLKDELVIFQLNNELEKLFLKLEREKEELNIYKEEVEQKISVLTKPIIISEGDNKTYLDKAKEFFAPDLDVEILEQKELGEKEILKLFNLLVKTQDREPVKIFIVDCDADKTFKEMEKIKTKYLIPFIFKKNEKNEKIPKGIENLFNQELFTDDFYESENKEGKYGAINTISEFQKNDFAEHVCNTRNSEDDFNNFKPLFEFIENNII